MSSTADLATLDRWLEANVPGLVGPCAVSELSGGYSNVTRLVRDRAGAQWVVRHPPVALYTDRTAHDVLREARIVAALAGSAVPVPEVVARCSDADVLGAPFYVMSFVAGEVVREPSDALRLEPAALVTVGAGLVDTLVELHRLDVDACGLGDLGPREDHVHRQLRRFGAQLHGADDLPLGVSSLLHEVHDRLAADIPAQGRVSLVHGDYRLDNTIVSPAGEVRAVVDWELAALGDPLVDVGMFAVYWREAGEDDFGLAMPSAAPGFSPRAELLRRYADRAGVPIEGLDYYMALGQWKLACINVGVARRAEAGVIHHDPAAIRASAVRRARHALTLLTGA